MATSKILRPTTRAWEMTSVVNSPAWANLTFWKNDSLRLGMFRFGGNDTTTPNDTISFDIPSGYLPEYNFSATLTAGGGYVEVRTDGKVRCVTNATKWSQGTLVYLLD